MRVGHLLLSDVQPRINLEILHYVITAIRYFTTVENGILNSVFIEACPSEPYNNFLGLLLHSKPLEHIPKLVATSSFTYSYEKHHRKPSLMVIHLGNGDARKILTEPLIYALRAWDSSSRVLVLMEVNVKNWHNVKLICAVLHQYKYHKVSTLGTSDFSITRYDMIGNVWGVWGYPVGHSELFEDATGNMKGKEIIYNFRFQSRHAVQIGSDYLGPNIQWIESTAKHLNTTARYLKNPCHEDACYMKFLDTQQVSIVLDPMALTKFDPSWPRILFRVTPGAETMLVPNGRTLNIIELFSRPFSCGAWVILVVVLGTMEVIKQLLPTYFVNDPILLSICGIERYNLHQAGRWEKIFYISLIIIFFLMTTAYEAKIIALITERPSTQVIRTLEALIQSGIPIKTDAGVNARKINDSLAGLPVDNGTFSWDGLSAYLAYIDVAKLMLTWPANYDLVSKRKRYVALPETLRITVGHYITESRSPLLDWLHWTQQVFFESGLTTKWQEAVVHVTHKPVRSFWQRVGYEAFDDSDLIKFAELAPAWIALGVGLFASGCVFLVEWIGRKWKLARIVHLVHM